MLTVITSVFRESEEKRVAARNDEEIRSHPEKIKNRHGKSSRLLTQLRFYTSFDRETGHFIDVHT